MELVPTCLELLYWFCVGLVAFAYLGYPILLGVAAHFRSRPVRRCEPSAVGEVVRSVSIILAVHNEEPSIRRRVQELVGLIEGAGVFGEVIVVSDGSSDRTAAVVSELARAAGDVPIRLIDLPHNVGKAAALTRGWEAARFEVLVLADVRQTWASDALVRLLENFADSTVGAVSGELVLQTAPGVMASVGLYWRYEKWLRQREARIHSTVGLTGAICAVRRRLFGAIPPGTLLDDVYWPLRVVMQGYRVVFDGRARAFDRLPDRVRSEFRRKVRTLSGNFQLLARLPSALLPWRNPVWVALVSHKLARLLVPWAWLGALALSGASAVSSPDRQSLYTTLFGLQALGTVGAAVALFPAVARRSRVASAAASLLVLNVAAFWAFCVWAAGGASKTWQKTVYQSPDLRTEPSLREIGRPAGGAGEKEYAVVEGGGSTC